MKIIAFVSAAILLSCGINATAQEPAPLEPSWPVQPATTLNAPISRQEQFTPPNLSLPAVTPELWLYSQQLRRYDDPAQAVRRKAEARSHQRMMRVAAMKWYGYSNSRPQASVTPFTSIFSPSWIGNGLSGYEWVGGSYGGTVVVERGYEYR